MMARETQHTDHTPTFWLSCPDCDSIRTEGRRLRATREKPEPLTPERIVKPFTDEHDRAEDHVASMLAAYLDPTDAERAANDVMARLHLSGYDFVKRGVRPPDCGDHYIAGYRAALRATPDPAEPGLDVERLARAMLRQGWRWTDLPDVTDAARDIAAEYAALSDTTEGQS
jgi:hypothetical protein